MSEVDCLIETFSHKSIISRVSKSNIALKSSLSGEAITISIKANKGLQDLFISKLLTIKLDIDHNNTIIVIPEYKVQITITNLDATTIDKLKDEIESRCSNKENSVPTNTTIQRQNLSLSKHRLTSFPLTPMKSNSTLNTKQPLRHTNAISPRQGMGKKERSPTHNNGYTPPTNKRPIIRSSPGKLNKSLFKSTTASTAFRSEPAPGSVPTVELTDTQQDILKTCCETTTNVFFTGCAGTGKSFLLKRIISQLYKVHGKDSVYITATTGLAACAINGVTIHQFAGLMVQQDDESSANNSAAVISKVYAVTFIIICIYTAYYRYIHAYMTYDIGTFKRSGGAEIAASQSLSYR